MTCDELRPLVGALVLGGLEPEEEARVRAHLARCPDCAAEHARLAPLPALLDRAAGVKVPEPPGTAAEEALLDRIARERAAQRPRRRVRRALPAGLAVAAALALVLGLGLRGEEPPGADPGAGYEVVLRPTATAPAARARASLEAVPEGTSLHLWVAGLPQGDRAVYEVRCSAGDWTASAGTFRADEDGRAYAVLTTAARRGQYDRIDIVRRAGRGAERVVLAARLDAPAPNPGTRPAYTSP